MSDSAHAHFPVSAPFPAPKRGGMVLRWAGLGILWVLLWASLIKFPHAASTELDASWQLVLSYAASHHLQFGQDIVFTSGPLAYLVTATNGGELYDRHIVWQILSNCVFATLFIVVGHRTRGVHRLAYYAAVFILISNFSDIVHMAAILSLSVCLMWESVAKRYWLTLLISACLVVLALTKFTNLLLIAFTVVCAAAYFASQRRWMNALTIIAGFAILFVSAWVLLGQSVSNIRPFLVNSTEVSTGYAGAMAIYESNGMLLLGLATGITLLAGFGVLALGSSDVPRGVAIALIAAAATFLNWKHGFTRADLHMLVHFLFSVFAALSYPALLTEQIRRWRFLGCTLLTTSAVLGLVGICILSSHLLFYGLAQWNNRATEAASYTFSCASHITEAHQQFAGTAAANALPEIKKIVGDRSVDILGYEQGYAVFNQLNYRPRPVIQGYSAYTEKLMRLNAAYYQSARAPEFVLQKLQTIDDRPLNLDDSLVTRFLYRNYRFVTEERGFLLWKHNPGPAQSEFSSVVSTSRLQFGRTIAVPDRPGKTVWLEIDMPPSWLGRVRSLLYKPPLVTILLTDNAGFVSSHRLVTEMARAGFLASPYFTSNYHLAKFGSGRAAARVASLKISVPEGSEKYFKSGATVRVIEMAAFPRTAPAVEKVDDHTFRTFNRQPSAVSAQFPPAALNEGGRDVVFANPPSEIAFDVDWPEHHVTGSFGLSAGSYTAPNHTDGAEFILEWIGPDGKTQEVFHRLLRPMDQAEDRGTKSFDVRLPGGKGRLVLRTTPGPNHDLAFDWAYWADVAFSK